MLLLGIDPGPEISGWVVYDTEHRVVRNSGIDPNDDLLLRCQRNDPARTCGHMAIEMPESRGMGTPISQGLLNTAEWVGIFRHAFGRRFTSRITRRFIKLHICEDTRAKDKNIRQALLDMWGGKTKALGRKKSPGPLYGMASHKWAALAVAVTWADTHKTRLRGGWMQGE